MNQDDIKKIQEEQIAAADNEIEFGKKLAELVSKFGVDCNTMLTRHQKELVKQDIDDISNLAEFLTKLLARIIS